MTVRLLGLDCSPRDNSNSGILLENVLREAGRHLPGRGRVRDHPPARPPHRALQGVQRLRQDQGRASSSPACARTRTTCRRSSTRWSPPTACSSPRRSTSACRPTCSPSSSCARGRCAIRTSSWPTGPSASWPPPAAARAAPRRPSSPRGCRSCATAASWSATATPPASSAPTAGPALAAHILSDEWGMEQGFQTAERVFTLARVFKAGVEATGFVNPMKFSYTSGRGDGRRVLIEE